ncbi:MAG: glutamate 5-kinase [Rubrimonas sp.]|uniref:glutamate 5-kinase n=1 Tax=Rubrimonas sp. TaxID=2036015 RepID=UPI002FDD0D7F
MDAVTLEAAAARSELRPDLRAAKRLVVKIGSALLVDAAGLRRGWLDGLAADIAELRAGGAEVLVVSSGAIALGRRVLGLPKGALPLEQAQAAAAVGQIELAQAYVAALAPHGIQAAQVLLTLADTQDRRRYLNARATLKTLTGLGAVPVINENDTTATDEIRYGDNDRLAARVALMAGADMLALLSDIDGLYTGDPRHDPHARHLPLVPEITPEIEAMAGAAGEGAKGGMVTKLMAAKTAMRGGCTLAIAKGAVDRPLSALADGGRCTWFPASETPAAARKQWIAAMKPAGTLVVDAGAAQALRRGASLLPAGLRRVEGVFERGDPVSVSTEDGAALGAALSGYNSDEAARIAGLRSGEIEAALGHPGRAAVAHRDDMVLWG